MGFGLVNFVVIDLSFLTKALLADVNLFLAALIRLTSHSGLVGHELVAGEDHAIDRDEHTVLEMDDIAHVQKVDVNGLRRGLAFLVRARHSNLNLNYFVNDHIYIFSQTCNVSFESHKSLEKSEYLRI